jgi:uncharacterized protein (DUF1800 family)
MDTNAALAFSRFGLGRRKDEPVPGDARAWLRAQLQGPDTAPSEGLLDSGQALELSAAFGRAAKAHKGDPTAPDPAPQREALHEHTVAEQAAFTANALTTAAPFRERLVWFWFNHFTIAARERPTAAVMGPYIREAIRPHVTGTFTDMLLAVMHHPGMLTYLDQVGSVGPNSPAGQRSKRGLNENLARECLELHTVSPASFYTQTDVTSFAKVLTGWSVQLDKPPHAFIYRPQAHEPGPQVVMGVTWPDGEQGGLQLLTWLATHPSTYQHLATKLVRHFVADDPPPADVAHIAGVLRHTGGDLGAASAALIDLPGAWVPGTKFRTPAEYVVATMRAVGAHPEAEPHMLDMISNLGQPLFRAPFPIGWPDRAADWAGPEAVLQRADFAYQFAGRITDQEPAEVAQATLGPLLHADTLAEIRGAGARRDGFTLLFASPEFQRR